LVVDESAGRGGRGEEAVLVLGRAETRFFSRSGDFLVRAGGLPGEDELRDKAEGDSINSTVISPTEEVEIRMQKK
jgi:hypothetical protein